MAETPNHPSLSLAEAHGALQELDRENNEAPAAEASENLSPEEEHDRPSQLEVVEDLLARLDDMIAPNEQDLEEYGLVPRWREPIPLEYDEKHLRSAIIDASAVYGCFVENVLASIDRVKILRLFANESSDDESSDDASSDDESSDEDRTDKLRQLAPKCRREIVSTADLFYTKRVKGSSNSNKFAQLFRKSLSGKRESFTQPDLSILKFLRVLGGFLACYLGTTPLEKLAQRSYTAWLEVLYPESQVWESLVDNPAFRPMSLSVIKACGAQLIEHLQWVACDSTVLYMDYAEEVRTEVNENSDPNEKLIARAKAKHNLLTASDRQDFTFSYHQRTEFLRAFFGGIGPPQGSLEVARDQLKRFLDFSFLFPPNKSVHLDLNRRVKEAKSDIWNRSLQAYEDCMVEDHRESEPTLSPQKFSLGKRPSQDALKEQEMPRKKLQH